MNADWTLTTGPASEPIALADARVHLRVDGTTEDALIGRMVAGVRASVEEYLGRGLLTQTWKYVQDGWSDEIRLPRAPLASVTKVEYYDASGTLQILPTSFYVVDTTAEPGRIRRAPNQVWPALQLDRRRAVVVTYVVGWTSAASIPAGITDGLYLLLTRRYIRRGDDAPQAAGVLDCPAAEACLAPYRVFWAPPERCD